MQKPFKQNVCGGIALTFSYFTEIIISESRNHNTSQKFWDQSPTLSFPVLFLSTWDSFLAQALTLLLFQYAAAFSWGNGPDWFLQTFQNLWNASKELTWFQ